MYTECPDDQALSYTEQRLSIRIPCAVTCVVAIRPRLCLLKPGCSSLGKGGRSPYSAETHLQSPGICTALHCCKYIRHIQQDVVSLSLELKRSSPRFAEAAASAAWYAEVAEAAWPRSNASRMQEGIHKANCLQ